MSKFLSKAATSVEPYVPGEQPVALGLTNYIKLNTNENPYPPSPNVLKVLKRYNYKNLRLYPSSDSRRLKTELAEFISENYNQYFEFSPYKDNLEIKPEQVFVANGSDEVLAMIFMAFTNPGDNVYFPDITYGFYSVYSELFRTKTNLIPLDETLSIQAKDYKNLTGTIFIANPNSPTGKFLSRDLIDIIANNPEALVVIDEAYIDFSYINCSCISQLESFDNLIVVQTFSKSRGLAGARLGYAVSSPEIIKGLERVKFSFNPYNVNLLTEDLAIASLRDKAYFRKVILQIKNTRKFVQAELKELDFLVIDSLSNFLFVKHSTIPSIEIYTKLREVGILVRHFDEERIKDFLRITIGKDKEMDELIKVLRDILE